MLEWLVYVLAGISGIGFGIWLKERPKFVCLTCDITVKYWQPHCKNCGRKFNWDWFQKRGFLTETRRWRILVPDIPQDRRNPTE